MSLNQFAGRRPGLAAVIAVAALLGAASAHASKVVKDPETGALRAPTAAELAAEKSSPKAALSRGQAQPRGLLSGKVAPQPVTHADGTVEQELDESSLQFSTVTRNPDGTLSFACVTGQEAADAIVKGKRKAKAAHQHTHADKELSYEK